MSMMGKVDRAIDLLDAKYPGWYGEITVERLDMKDYWDCVIGQLAEATGSRGYTEMLETLTDDPELYGFDLGVQHESRWQELQTCWEQRLWELQLERGEGVMVG